MSLLSAITTNRTTYDWVLIIAAILFFVSALVHIPRPGPVTPQALAFMVGMLGATALAVGLLFV